MRATPAPLLLGVLLLATLSPPAAASSHLTFDYDVKDVLHDAFILATDTSVPEVDITRFTTKLDGAEVVQTVEVVGPWPVNNDSVEIVNFFGSSETLTLKVARTSQRSASGWITNFTTSSISSPDMQRVAHKVNFTYERGDATMTIRWPASEIPANAKCMQPTVRTHTIISRSSSNTQADDEMRVLPSPCFSEHARMEGTDGSCPPAAPSVVKAGTIEDARDDVGERDSNVWLPHDDPTMDLVSVATRLDGAWVVQDVVLVEDSGRKVPDISIESQLRGNKSLYERGAYVKLSLLDTSASGSLLGEGSSAPIFVEAQRLEGSTGWRFRWCASHIPADAECFSVEAIASRNNFDLRDKAGLAKSACPEPDPDAPYGGEEEDEEGGATTSTPGGASAAGDGGDAGGSENGTPGIGAFALLAAVAAAALALRRRA